MGKIIGFLRDIIIGSLMMTLVVYLDDHRYVYEFIGCFLAGIIYLNILICCFHQIRSMQPNQKRVYEILPEIKHRIVFGIFASPICFVYSIQFYVDNKKKRYE